MKLPVSWLREYVEIKEPPEKLAEDLLFSGTKVEKIEKTKEDVIFNFEITPNRADCLSVIGIAREIAAIYSRILKIPASFSHTQTNSKEKLINLEVKESYLCPYYSLGVIDNVKIGPSPNWLSDRLEKSGIRSLNNIIDITNYVMLETGQPMHAFDYDKVTGKLILRASREGERVRTLDNTERILPKGSIIIEDSEKLIDLAGLMGGKNSEVDINTKTLILHVPVYNPVAIRHTSQATNLRTEASNRFEKLLDPALHRYAFERATELFSTLASGKLVSPIESIGYPPKEKTIKFPISLINKILGIRITKDKTINLLERLGFSTCIDKDQIIVGIPSFRTDITNPTDLTEEIGRLYGYNKFPKTLPSGKLPTKNYSEESYQQKLKNILEGLGLKEIYTNTLVSSKQIEDLGFKTTDCLKVSNPLVKDFEYLRPSLFIGLLSSTRLNQDNFNKFILFEIGRTFEKKMQEDGLPRQPFKIGVLALNYSFGYLKGILETILNKLNIKGVSFDKEDKNKIDIYVKNNQIGHFNFFNGDILSKFNIKRPSCGFELDFEKLILNISSTNYKPIPNFPTVKENISLFLPPDASYITIKQAIQKGASKHYFSAELLEDTVISGKRSILIGVEYYDPKHTLNKEDIEIIRNSIIKQLEGIGAKIRTAVNPTEDR